MRLQDSLKCMFGVKGIPMQEMMRAFRIKALCYQSAFIYQCLTFLKLDVTATSKEIFDFKFLLMFSTGFVTAVLSKS